MKFFSLAGRSTRAEWWVLNTFGMVAMNTLLFFEVNSRGTVGPRTCLVALLLYFAISLPVTFRRLHDVNWGGSLSFVFLMTNWFLPVSINQGFCHNPFVLPVIVISGVCQIIFLGCKDGTMGPNNYGNDPRGRQGLFSRQDVVVNLSNRNDVEQRMTGNSVEQRLTQLKKLKDQGMISDAEYEDKRSKILSDI